MTQDEIIEMLRASCDKDRVDPEQNGFWVIVTEELERFAKLVAHHEREECLKFCDQVAEYFPSSGFVGSYIGQKIRARGQG